MIPYYTGAAEANKPQSNPNKSLGGLISNSKVPNGALNNVFPPISKRHVEESISDVRLIAFKNGASALTAMRVWTVKGQYCTYTIAAVSPAINSCGDLEFESIDGGNDLPYQATFTSNETEPNALVVGNVVADAVLGIWIKRDVDVTNLTELDGKGDISALTCTQLEDLLRAANEAVNEELSQLILDWV